MDGQRGGSGRWCPDCGTPLAPGQAMCARCGLDCTSRQARDAERANGEVHRIRARIGELTAQERSWLDYRKEVLALAHGASGGAGADLVGESGVTAAREGIANASPMVGPGDEARAPEPRPMAAPGSPFSAPTAQMFQSPAQNAPGWLAVEQARSSPAIAMKPARRLTAAVLLGISGAALVILAGIVFVAASWSTYGPAARMVILVAFAATFAWLAWTSARHDFPAVGGALGVVSAAFVGVSVYAVTAGPSGPAPFTTAIATLVAGIAGLSLSRLNIKAVGEASAGAVVFAAEAAAIEAAVRSSSVTVGMGAYAIVASLAGAAIVATRVLWGSGPRRSIAAHGGMAVAFLASLIAVLSPLTTRGVDGRALAALALSVAVCVGIAAWRPRWGAGVVTGATTVGAVTAASMWTLDLGQLSLVFGVAVIAAIAGLGRMPAAWRTPGLLGLLPGLAGFALALIFVSMVVLPEALAGSHLEGGSSTSGIGALGWFGAALLLIAAVPFVATTWKPPALLTASWAGTAGAAAFAGATVSLALEAAGAAAHGPAAAGGSLVVAALAQWFAAPMWGAPRATPIRGFAVALAVGGGVHGALTVALNRDWHASLAWGSVGISIALVALAVAAVRMRHAAGACAFVAVAGASAWTWRAWESYGYVLVAAAVVTLVIAVAATKLAVPYAAPVLAGNAPAYVAAGIGALAGGVLAAGSSLATHPSATFPATLSSTPSASFWAPAVAACIALAGPAIAILVDRAGVSAPRRVTQVVSGSGFVVLAVTALARLQDIVAAVGAVAPTVADAVSTALAVGVGGAVWGLVALVSWWRPARWFVGIGVVVLASLHGAVGLGRLAFDAVDLWWAAGAVAFGAAALGLASRWVPKVALGPAVFLASLVLSAALAPHHGDQALAVASVVAAAIAWSARRSRGVARVATLAGGLPAMLIAAVAALYAAVLALESLGNTWTGHDAGWRPWLILVVTAATLGVLAWPPARGVAAGIGALGLVMVGGFVPAPAGWIALAVVGALSTEAAARWGRMLGLHALVPLGVGIAAVAWSVGTARTAAVALAALALGAMWTAIRAKASPTGAVALVLAPVAGATSVFLALGEWHVASDLAATIAAGVALAITLGFAAAGLDPQRRVTVGMLAVTSVVGPLLTVDLALAGAVVLLACAAWFTLSTLGVRWARWVALGGLSVAAALLAAAVGLSTLEAYTAVPAITMIIVGMWWMRRDPRIRTYFALAPGLGTALVPSYLALALDPSVVERTLALIGAALVLAVVGVALRWFAPLLATALTAVVVALSQIFIDNSLAPIWADVGVIGGVFFALALLAERIKAMR